MLTPCYVNAVHRISFMPLLSVIMPVFNTDPKYLRIALRSVLNQTLKDLELIVVDDHSTDLNVPKILSEFSDQRISYLRNAQNKGLGATRNVGIEHAHGDYIGFIDSDDFIDSDMFEHLINESKLNDDAEIVGCRLSLCDENGVDYEGSQIQAIKDKLVCTTKEEKINSLINGSTCNKIFKASLIHDIRFPEDVLFEDNLFIVTACDAANRLVQLPNGHYHYRKNPTSLVNSKQREQQRRAGKIRCITDILSFGLKKSYRQGEMISLMNFCRGIFAPSFDTDVDLLCALKKISDDEVILKNLFTDSKHKTLKKIFLFNIIELLKISKKVDFSSDLLTTEYKVKLLNIIPLLKIKTTYSYLAAPSSYDIFFLLIKLLKCDVSSNTARYKLFNCIPVVKTKNYI